MAATADENSSGRNDVVGRASPDMWIVYVGSPFPPPEDLRGPPMASDDEVRDALAGVREPLLHRTLGDLGLAGPVRVDGSRVDATVLLVTEEHPAVDELDGRV